MNMQQNFLFFLIIITLATGCKEEIKEKLTLFVEGKDFKTLFLKYASNDDMNSEQMKELLIDAGVSYWCRWPAKVIEKLDANEDERLSWKEVSSALKKTATPTDVSKVETLDIINTEFQTNKSNSTVENLRCILVAESQNVKLDGTDYDDLTDVSRYKHRHTPALATIELYESLKSFAKLLQSYHEEL